MDMTAEIIPFDSPPPPVMVCSFCDRPESMVQKMFSNNREGGEVRYMCNVCVLKMFGLFHGEVSCA